MICLMAFLSTTSGVLAGPATHGLFYNVKDYAAKGDGVTRDTKAINACIEAVSAAGGGTVYFPAGKYLTGSIHLKSDLTLYLDQGAVIIAAEGMEDYDLPEPAINDLYQDYGHSHFHNSLIWGEHLQNVTIMGNGMIWGKGLVRRGHKGNNFPNKSIALLSCKNVIIRDITIYHGGWFAILATGVDNLTIDNLRIDTQRDGIDLDCCQQVRVSNCTVNCPGDDAICLKSSFALGYTRATRDVVITNCQLSGYNEGSLLDGTYGRTDAESGSGRIKFGTESNGGFQNIAITNCIFDYSQGLALETVDGAILEDITISNITMRDIVNAPIFIRLGARLRAPDSLVTGKCRRILISELNVFNANNDSAGAIISGIPGHEIEDLEMHNVHLYFKGGGAREMADKKVPEFEKDSPDPKNFGALPAAGFFIRHVKNLRMSDVTIKFLEAEYRPPVILDRVENARFRILRVQGTADIPRMVLENTVDIDIRDSDGIKDLQTGKTGYQILGQKKN
ncbi:MAG: glycoside hydrolase family 28 protein [Terrimonas sp.]|nr:glycoside hydrolase family 28 protein [Terrimonas sp.]